MELKPIGHVRDRGTESGSNGYALGINCLV